MKIIEYIIEVLICSGLFLVLYRWLLAGKVSYRICRAYIVGTMLLAAVIPALDVPLYPPVQSSAASGTVIIGDSILSGYGELTYSPDRGFAAGITDSATPASGAAKTARQAVGYKDTVLKILAAVYCLTAAVSIALILLNTARIRRLRRSARLTRMEDCTLAESEKVQTPFSFLRTVYMGQGYAPSERLMILTHEVSHVRHRHSYERLTLSALRSLLWFNPFLWMAEKDLREVQEWEADRDVLDKGHDLTLYRTAVFKQLFGYNPDISSGLNHSLTKKRFIMMTKTQLGRYAALRLAATLPLLTVTFLAFGCGNRTQTPPEDINGTGKAGIQATPNAGIQTDSVTVIDISMDGDEYVITVNGNECSVDKLKNICIGTDGQDKTVRIDIGDGVYMGIVTDVTNSLCKADSLKSVTIVQDNGKQRTLKFEFNTSDSTWHETVDMSSGTITLASTSLQTESKPEEYTITVETVKEGDRTSVTVNGKACDSESVLTDLLEEYLTDKDITGATLRFEGQETQMGTITDIMNAIRQKTGTVTIQFETDGTDAQKLAVMADLPPEPRTDEYDTEVINVTSDKREYFHFIMLNSQNAINFDGYHVQPEDITDMAANIIRKQGICAEEGFPGCIFSIEYDRNTSLNAYVNVRRALTDAFIQVRESYAMEHFGKSLNALSREELSQVQKAIPVKISEAHEVKHEEPPRH